MTPGRGKRFFRKRAAHRAKAATAAPAFALANRCFTERLPPTAGKVVKSVRREASGALRLVLGGGKGSDPLAEGVLKEDRGRNASSHGDLLARRASC
jgi:hypothetical protein